jgi:hypothetical protein
VLKTIPEPKRVEIVGGWRKLHDMELHNLYSLPDIIRMIKSSRMRWAEHEACMGEKMNACKILVETPEGERPLGRPRCRWEDNIKMDHRKIGWWWYGLDMNQ